MVGFKYLYIFLLLIKCIFTETITEEIENDGTLEDYGNTSKDLKITAKGNFRIETPIRIGGSKIEIIGKEDGRSVVDVSAVKEDLFFFQEKKIEITIKNLKFVGFDHKIFEVIGFDININIINCEFNEMKDSVVSAVNINTLRIEDSEFNKNEPTVKPPLFVENKKNDDTQQTSVIMRNCIGMDNNNDIKDVQQSGGWGCFINTNIDFDSITSKHNTNNNNGAVFNIRNCDPYKKNIDENNVKKNIITNSIFENSNYQGKGVIYQYHSVVEISNTEFKNNEGFGAGIYYVYGTNGDNLEQFKPSTIRNCTFEGNRGVDTQRGAAIFTDGAQTVDIYDSTFKDLNVVSRGAAFQLNGKTKISTTNCIFEDIYAVDAGAVFNCGYETTVVIKDCKFKRIYANIGAIINGNSGNHINADGLIVEDSASQTSLFRMVEYNVKTELLFNNITVSNSIAAEGIFYLYKNSYENSDVTFKVTNSKFVDNGISYKVNTDTKHATYSVSTAAPVINISDVGKSDVTIDNCEFIRNHVNITSGIGGVLSLNLSRRKPLKFLNLSFVNNTVEADGGGIYVGPLDSEDAIIEMRFENITFIGNKATGNGGGLFIDNIKPVQDDIFRSFEMKNLSFKNNTAGECGGGMAVLSDVFKDNVLSGFEFEFNSAEIGGGAYYTKDYKATPRFENDPPNSKGNIARFGRFLSSEPAKFEFKGKFESNLKIYSGKELKGYTFQLLDAWNNLYVSDNVFSNVKTLTFLAVKIVDEDVYLNENSDDKLVQSQSTIIRGNTFELFDKGICQLDQFKIYGKPGVYYLIFYIPLSGHTNLVHQNITARLTITDCDSEVTGLYPVNATIDEKFEECQSPKCEGRYACLNGGQCIRPPFDSNGNLIDYGVNKGFCDCQSGYKGNFCEDVVKYQWKTGKLYFFTADGILIGILVLCIIAIIFYIQKLLFSSSFPWLLIACTCVCIYSLSSIFFFIDDSLSEEDEDRYKNSKNRPDDFDVEMCVVYPFIHYSSFIILWGIIMFIFYRSKPIVALPNKSNTTSAQISIRQSFFVQSSNNNSNADNLPNKEPSKTDPNKSNTDFSISFLEKESKQREELIHLILTIVFTIAYVSFLIVWLVKSIKAETEKNSNGVYIKDTNRENDTLLRRNQKKISNGHVVQFCQKDYLEPFTYVQLFLLLFGITFTNRKWSLGGYHIDLRHFAFAMANWILCGPFITIITFTMMNDNPNAQLSLYRVSIMLSMTPIIPIIVVPKILLINDKNVNTDDYSTFAIPFSEKQVSKVTSNYNSDSQTGTGAASSFNQGKGSAIESGI